MSVIGLMVSLTHLLTRTRSRHAVCDITMSRGCDGAAAAIAGVVGAEFDPADRRTRGVAKARIDNVTGFRRDAVTLIPNRMATTANPFPCPLNNIVAPVFLVGTTFRTKDLRRR